MSPAKKGTKKIGRPPVPGPKRSIASFRGSKAFSDWFDAFIKSERDNGAILIEKALVHSAQHRGFKLEPPER